MQPSSLVVKTISAGGAVIKEQLVRVAQRLATPHWHF
jgi:hypothetical protein